MLKFLVLLLSGFFLYRLVKSIFTPEPLESDRERQRQYEQRRNAFFRPAGQRKEKDISDSVRIIEEKKLSDEKEPGFGKTRGKK